LPTLLEGEPLTALRYWRTRGAVLADATDALAAYREGLALLLRLPQTQWPQDARSELEFNMANNLALLGRFDESIALVRAVIGRRSQELGERHPKTLYAGVLLANDLVLTRQYDEARTTITETLAGLDQALGPQARYSLRARAIYADLEMRTRHFAAAAVLWSQAQQGMARSYGEHSEAALGDLNNLANTLRFKGDAAEAEATHRRVLAGFEASGARDHRIAMHGRYGLAASLLDQERGADETAQLLAALDTDSLNRAEARSDWPALLDYQRGRLALLRGQDDEALRLLERAAAGLDPEGLYLDDAPDHIKKLLSDTRDRRRAVSRTAPL
jgi:tetratricopeptide (TPR) repeat protein